MYDLSYIHWHYLLLALLWFWKTEGTHQVLPSSNGVPGCLWKTALPINLSVEQVKGIFLFILTISRSQRSTITAQSNFHFSSTVWISRSERAPTHSIDFKCLTADSYQFSIISQEILKPHNEGMTGRQKRRKKYLYFLPNSPRPLLTKQIKDHCGRVRFSCTRQMTRILSYHTVQLFSDTNTCFGLPQSTKSQELTVVFSYLSQ